MVRQMRAALAALATGLLVLAPVAGCGGGVLSPDVVLVNGGEPPNPLIPTGTNDSNGGRIIDRLFAGLMSYDALASRRWRSRSQSRAPITSTTGSLSNPAGSSPTARR